MKKRTFAIAVVAIVALAGCIKNQGSNSPRSGVLVDLLSPNAINTTIVVNGNTIGSNISYGSVPSYYNVVTSGNSNLTIYASTTQTLLNKDFRTDEGKYYSIFVVDSASKMKPIIVTDSASYPNATDSVKVRFYNFAPNSIPLNVVVKDSATIWANRAFETQESANAYNRFLDMKAGRYNFQVFSPYNISMPLKDTTITFDGKHIYTLFIKGFYPDSTGTTAISLGVVKHG